MDPASLITATTLECAGWLKPVAAGNGDGGATNARATQDRLVGVVRSAMRQRLSVQSVKESLFVAINATSKGVIEETPGAIDEVRRSGANYLMEFEAIDETIREVYKFEQLPFIGQAEQSFKLMAPLRELPQRQQASIIQLLELELDHFYTAVHMRFAQEDGDSQKRKKLSAEFRELELRVAQVSARLNPDAVTVKNAFQEVMSHLEVLGCPPVAEAVVTSSSAELMFAAASMDRAGDSLIQSLPITKDTKAATRSKAVAAWMRLGELGNTLQVLAIWLRALAVEGGSRRCVLCYRHIGYGGKNFCAEHQRQGGKRQPARVFHVARIYPDELERLSKTELGLKAAIAKVAQFESERLHMSEASFPEGVTIPEPLIQSASILLIALRRAAPALGPELGGLVDGVWKELVQIASEPYVATGQSSRDDVTLRRVQQEKARRWLTWRTFFEAWWAKSYQGPGSSPQTLNGQGFDIDHPITQGYAIPPSGVVVDLLQQRAWTRAEKRVETEAYVSVHLIRKKARSGRSLRSVGKELGVSYETVRKKLLNAKKNGSAKVQRPRARSSFTGQ